MENTVVELNQDIGCYLLRFLDRIDATTFIEAVNNTRQLGSIVKTSCYHFIQIIKIFSGHPRILLPRELVEDFGNECEIDDKQLIIAVKRYSDKIEPSRRIYIHPCFSTEGFTKLCEVYNIGLMQKYPPIFFLFYVSSFY